MNKKFLLYETKEDYLQDIENLDAPYIAKIIDTGELFYVSAIGGSGGNSGGVANLIIETTYSELKTLRDEGNLIPGVWYRITDYVTTTVQEDTQSANHLFDIIVEALSNDTLSENARAIRHEGDTYFEDCKLEAWEIKYDIENNDVKYAWADTENGKGVIYYMKDEWGNECPYDFKNVQFKRYKISDAFDDDLVGLYTIDGATKITADTSMTYWVYTFAMIDTSDDIAHDVSVEQNKYLSDEGFYYKTHDNIFKPLYEGNGDIGDSQMKLPNNAFVTDTDICAISETYGEFYGFDSNTFGNSCNYNTFGNGCGSNTFGNGCYSNTFGNGCYYNTFGNNYWNNTFGNDCWNNTFGNSCGNNTFGNSCNYNTFGNDCRNNTFGNSCNYNTFGNACQQITFAKDYMSYNIVENGNQYITVTSTQTTSGSSVLRNFTISQGVNNSTTQKTISHNTLNDTFKTVYLNSNSAIVNV